VEYQSGEFVLFVTFGSEQGEHKFDEGVTSSGVVTWQSQPNQRLDSPVVRGLIPPIVREGTCDCSCGLEKQTRAAR